VLTDIKTAQWRSNNCTVADTNNAWHWLDLKVCHPRCGSDGYLAINVSNKDVIVKGGENVFPQEIEGGIEEMEGIVEPEVIGGPTDIGAKESLRWS